MLGFSPDQNQTDIFTPSLKPLNSKFGIIHDFEMSREELRSGTRSPVVRLIERFSSTCRFLNR
jgi:hypothetical protein